MASSTISITSSAKTCRLMGNVPVFEPMQTGMAAKIWTALLVKSASNYRLPVLGEPSIPRKVAASVMASRTCSGLTPIRERKYRRNQFCRRCRQAPGAVPKARLNARLKVASDS